MQTMSSGPRPWVGKRRGGERGGGTVGAHGYRRRNAGDPGPAPCRNRECRTRGTPQRRSAGGNLDARRRASDGKERRRQTPLSYKLRQKFARATCTPQILTQAFSATAPMVAHRLLHVHLWGGKEDSLLRIRSYSSRRLETGHRIRPARPPGARHDTCPKRKAMAT